MESQGRRVPPKQSFVSSSFLKFFRRMMPSFCVTYSAKICENPMVMESPMKATLLRHWHA